MSSRKNTKTSAPKGEKAVKNVEDVNVSSVVEQSVLNQNGSDNIEENSEVDQAKESVNDSVSVPEQEQTDAEQEQSDSVSVPEQEQSDAVNDAVYVPEQEQTDETKSKEISVQNKQERPLVLNSGKVIVNKPLFPQNKYNKKIIVKKFC